MFGHPRNKSVLLKFSFGWFSKYFSIKRVQADRLKEITVPTLVIGAKYDSMTPKHMEWMATEIQNGRFLYCPNGGHLSQFDDPEHYFPGIIQFFKDVNE